jgi:hypothetical protein
MNFFFGMLHIDSFITEILRYRTADNNAGYSQTPLNVQPFRRENPKFKMSN